MRLVKSRVRVAEDLVHLFTGKTGLEWMFSEVEQRYYSFKGGEIYSRISGKNLPDPDLLFAKRCNQLGVFTDSVDAVPLKPTLDTYLLFDDWSKRNA